MKSNKSYSFGCLSVFAILLLMSLHSQQLLSQTRDSLSGSGGGALQFQLIGNLGMYYLVHVGSSSYLRVGVNGSYDHTDNSGDGNNYYFPSSSSQTKPSEKSTSYSVALSGVFALKIAGFANSALYCGLGPLTSYSVDNSYSTLSYSYTSDVSNLAYTQVHSSANKVWGVGPLGILAVRTHLFGSVGLTAEVDLSAQYQWTSGTSNDHYERVDPTSGSESSNGGTNQHLAGWKVEISSIIIGVDVEL